jgi:adenylate kinase
MLNGVIALLTGPPGVGKTTIATALARRHPKAIEAVSFGRLVYEAVASRLGESLSYTEFRQCAAQLVSREDIAVATTLLTSRKSAFQGKWLLVDSHAVAKTSYGCQAHPDTPETLRRFSYDAVLYLHAAPRVILSRIRQEPSGRHVSVGPGMDLVNSVQMSVAVYYAGITGCPLEIVDATGGESDVVQALESLLGLGPGLFEA